MRDWILSHEGDKLPGSSWLHLGWCSFLSFRWIFMEGFGSFGPCSFLVLSMVLRPLCLPWVVCLSSALLF